MDNLKTIEVVAAIIRREDKIFATQRGYGDFKDWWEFPMQIIIFIDYQLDR